MLILTRRIGETIFIDGGEIKITTLGIKGNQVRLGIDAPRGIPVHREEVQERINTERKEDQNEKYNV